VKNFNWEDDRVEDRQIIDTHGIGIVEIRVVLIKKS
jgi:hypothetical protein